MERSKGTSGEELRVRMLRVASQITSVGGAGGRPGGSPKPSLPGLAPSAPQPSSMATRVKGSRSEEHTSELQSLMRISYAVFCLKKKTSTSTDSQNRSNNTNQIS